ncbi:energy-coupling factor ABC transporter ATP-binding protein [Thalassococcus sp. BH17M4-6]|uniref:energy-coupling factor ABC transporter ATP-binding protein n=1 Tax=Thalassococcus sp. BH17M4-6 TaxID=3413148 RepID=UPI003BBE09A5
MIELTSVHVAYQDRVVLRDISLTLTERRIGIIGSNGSGKSTFARLLNGLLLPSSGQVRVDGLDTRKDGKAVRRKVGFVFQNPDNQIVFPTVEEDIAFGMKNLGYDKNTIARKADEVLDRYGLQDHRTHPSHFLSGGQKQLLAISGVLVMAPDYIVFDEPTTLLDLRNKIRVARAIDALDQTAVVVTHDLDLLGDFDRVIVFADTRIIADGPPDMALRTYRDTMRDV